MSNPFDMAGSFLDSSNTYQNPELKISHLSSSILHPEQSDGKVIKVRKSLNGHPLRTEYRDNIFSSVHSSNKDTHGAHKDI